MSARIKALEARIHKDLKDPRYEGISMDPILDIISLAQRRIDTGAYQKRVIDEALLQVDEYLMCYVGFRQK